MPNPTLDDLFDSSSAYFNGGVNLSVPPGGKNVFTDALNPATLVAGELQGNTIIRDGYLKSYNFTAGSVGWYIDALGNAVFKSITALSSRAFTVFETAGRFSQVVSGTGSTSFALQGVVLATGATQNSQSYNRWLINNTDIFTGNPTTSILVTVDIATSDANIRYMGLGDVGSTIDVTLNHAGFKIIGTSLYATQGNGTTETASAALTTVANGDLLDLIFKIKDSSIDYYWRKNAGSFSSVTTLTTNLPSSVSSYATFVAYNSASATDIGLKVHACSYER